MDVCGAASPKEVILQGGGQGVGIPIYLLRSPGVAGKCGMFLDACSPR